MHTTACIVLSGCVAVLCDLDNARYLHTCVHGPNIAIVADIFGFDAHAKHVMLGNALLVFLFFSFLLWPVICVLLIKNAY